MKQRITIEQLNELTEEQKDKLWEWWTPKKGDFIYDPWRKKSHLISGPRYLDKKEKYLNDEPPESYIVKVYPLLSIGQMLEIMHARNSSFGNHYIDIDWDGELADFLWKEVKIVLEDTPTP